MPADLAHLPVLPGNRSATAYFGPAAGPGRSITMCSSYMCSAPNLDLPANTTREDLLTT